MLRSAHCYFTQKGVCMKEDVYKRQMSGYTVAKKVALNVVDYDQAEKAWMTDIINKVTTSGLSLIHIFLFF